MDLQRSGERGDGRQKALLQPDEGELRHGISTPGLGGKPRGTHFAVGGKPPIEVELQCFSRKAIDHDLLDSALGKGFAETAKIRFEAPDHDRFEVLRANLNATCEALRIQDLQQGGEGVAVPVVRRRAEEQPVLEALRQAAHDLGELARHRIAPATGRGGVMSLVEHQQGTGAELAQYVREACRVGLLGEEAMGDDEAGARRPRVDPKAAGPPQLGNPLPIDDLEGEAELGLELVLPLHRHGRRRRDDDEFDASPQQHLAHDKAGLDGLPEADVIGDQQVDARQP